MPKYSVVTISYNQAGFLEETIKSVLKQKKYVDLEYIIIDGGSKDGSLDIIEQYKDGIDIWISEQDDGPGDALNKGFSKAKGEFILYLNSDDLFVDDAFKKIDTAISNNPGADVYYGNGYMHFDHCNEQVEIMSDRWSLFGYYNETVSIVQQATVIRNSAFQKITGFNVTNFDNWDGELLVDLALSGAKFQRFSEFIGVFRMYPGSISGANSNKERYKKTKERIRRKIKSITPKTKVPYSLAKMLTSVQDPFTAIERYKKSKRINFLKQEMDQDDK